jgi:hypothetical protein
MAEGVTMKEYDDYMSQLMDYWNPDISKLDFKAMKGFSTLTPNANGANVDQGDALKQKAWRGEELTPSEQFYLQNMYGKTRGGVQWHGDEGGFAPNAALSYGVDRSGKAFGDDVDYYDRMVAVGSITPERAAQLREQAKNPPPPAESQAAPGQDQGSLWQTIMGYYPNLPKDYGWQQGWDKFGGKPQSQVYGAPPEMTSVQAATNLNPGLSSVLSKGLMNSQDADQGTGNPGWPNNGPEFPNGEGETYGSAPTPPATTPPTEQPPTTEQPPKTDAPYTPPPATRGAPTPTSSPWDPIVNNYATGQNPMLGQLMQMMMGYARKPSGYDSDMLMGSYKRMNAQLGEDYDVERQKIKEEMYRRGVSDSSIHGGRLGDVATDQARAQEDLAYKLLTDAAQQQSSDQQNSLGMLMNLYGLTNQDQATRMGMGLSYNDQRFNQWLQQYMMNHQVDQDELDFWLKTMGL